MNNNRREEILSHFHLPEVILFVKNRISLLDENQNLVDHLSVIDFIINHKLIEKEM